MSKVVLTRLCPAIVLSVIRSTTPAAALGRGEDKSVSALATTAILDDLHDLGRYRDLPVSDLGFRPRDPLPPEVFLAQHLHDADRAPFEVHGPHRQTSRLTPAHACGHNGNLVIYGPGGLYIWDSATD